MSVATFFAAAVAAGLWINPPIPRLWVWTVAPRRPADNGGIDGGKKLKGTKVHLLVDKLGFPLSLGASAADAHDTVGILPALENTARANSDGTALGNGGVTT